MTCGGCGNKEAVHTVYVCGKGETCEKCGGHGMALGTEKKTGFMFGNKLLHKNANKKLANNVRQTYRGDDSDTVGIKPS